MRLAFAAACLLAAAANAEIVLAGEFEARLPRPRPALPGDAPAVEADTGLVPAAPDLSGLTPVGAASGSAAAEAIVEGDPAIVVTVEEGTASAANDIDNPADALAHVARLPHPVDEGARSSALALREPGDEDRRAEPRAPFVPSEDDIACLARLKSLGVEFSREQAIAPGTACHVDMPLNVTGLGGGVALAPEAILNCRTAEALALWVRDSVVPAAQKRLGAAPTKIVHASTYVCRPRNNVAGARLSEHANANAVDIASIAFADRDAFDVKAWPRGSAEGRFAADIRGESCDYFTTVLGPGSNAAHATHFHLDMAVRRGGYRLCELGGEATAGRADPNTKRE